MTTAILCAALMVAGAEPKEWNYGPGGWQEAAPTTPAGDAPTPGAPVGNASALTVEPPGPVNLDGEFDPMVELLDRGRSKAAFKRTVRWLLDHPVDPLRDQALFLAARALYDYGNRTKAFFYCDELMDTYPESPLYDDALRLQYAIADAYLSGYKARLLGLPISSETSDATEMLFRIQERAPGSPLAEEAVLRAADFFYEREDFDFAAIYYAAYIEQYPRAPRAPEAKLRLAFSHLLEYRGPRFDSGPVIDARNLLNELIAEQPDMAEQRNLAHVVREIDVELAQKRLTTGDYYRRAGEKRAAALAYRSLLEDYPNSPLADEARARLRSLGEVPDVAEVPNG